MTIEIEAGASQSQFSMKPLAVHAFFGGQPWNCRLATTDADLAQHGPVGSGNSEPLIPEILSRSALEGETSSKFR
jgi:hypothetical protein